MRAQSVNGPDELRRDRLIGSIASRQFGVISREQLRASGIDRGAVGRALRAGRLHPVYRGVYAVGHTALTPRAHWQAALLACGEQAALSFRSSSHLWELLLTQPLPVEVTVCTGGSRSQSDLIVHRSPLHPDEVQLYDGLRVTSPARTIVDMAGRLAPHELRRLVERAQDRRRFHPALINNCLERRPRLPGCRGLRDLLVLLAPDKDNARSHLERLFLHLLGAHKLPLPEVNYAIGGKQRDFAWPDQRLVVETDGHAFHSSPQARRRDARRDRALLATGWRPARFTFEEVAFEPDVVAREVEGLLRL